VRANGFHAAPAARDHDLRRTVNHGASMRLRIARRAGSEEESAHLRQEVKRIRQVIEQTRTGIATRSNRFRTFLGQASTGMITIGLHLAQESNHHRTRFDDFPVEVIARSGPCKSTALDSI
jgi:hypothetical protein